MLEILTELIDVKVSRSNSENIPEDCNNVEQLLVLLTSSTGTGRGRRRH